MASVTSPDPIGIEASPSSPVGRYHAWVGVTEDDAKKQGLKYGVGKFPWAASGRAIANGRDEGFTKLLFDEETHRVIGGAAYIATVIASPGVIKHTSASAAGSGPFSCHTPPTGRSEPSATPPMTSSRR